MKRKMPPLRVLLSGAWLAILLGFLIWHAGMAVLVYGIGFLAGTLGAVWAGAILMDYLV